MPEIFPPRSISISPYVIVPESRPVERTSSRLRTTRSPSNAPWISACSVALSPLKRPPSLISTSLQLSNFASTVPSTMSRLQEVISPENEVPEPTTIVRISTCLLDGSDCGSAFWGGGGEGSAEPRRLLGRHHSPDFATGCAGFSGTRRLSA